MIKYKYLLLTNYPIESTCFTHKSTCNTTPNPKSYHKHPKNRSLYFLKLSVSNTLICHWNIPYLIHLHLLILSSDEPNRKKTANLWVRQRFKTEWIGWMADGTVLTWTTEIFWLIFNLRYFWDIKRKSKLDK